MELLDLAKNKGGIQGHSQGEVFPIVEYQIGDSRYMSQAPFAPCCELESNNFEGQRRNSYRLKRLEQLCDQAYESLKATAGFTVCYKKAEYNASSGYMVGMAGNEEIVSIDRPYGAMFKYLFDHRGQLSSGFCIGGWTHAGKLYLDVSLWFADRADALAHAVCNGQIAIWDNRNGNEIPV